MLDITSHATLIISSITIALHVIKMSQGPFVAIVVVVACSLMPSSDFVRLKFSLCNVATFSHIQIDATRSSLSTLSTFTIIFEITLIKFASLLKIFVIKSLCPAID